MSKKWIFTFMNFQSVYWHGKRIVQWYNDTMSDLNLNDTVKRLISDECLVTDVKLEQCSRVGPVQDCFVRASPEKLKSVRWEGKRQSFCLFKNGNVPWARICEVEEMTPVELEGWVKLWWGEEEKGGLTDVLFTMSSGWIPMARHSSEIEGEGKDRQKVHVLSLLPHHLPFPCHPEYSL